MLKVVVAPQKGRELPAPCELPKTDGNKKKSGASGAASRWANGRVRSDSENELRGKTKS